MASPLIEAIGTVAAVCSMSSFMPQLIKLIREREAEAVSLRMYAVTVTGFCLWLAYGVMLGSWPLMVSNGVSLSLSAAILGLKIHFDRAGRPERAPAPAADRPIDCLVVGAGPAGLTAALYLGRFRRSVVVAHDGESRAATIPRSQNVPGYANGIAGKLLIKRMTAQAQRFGARIEDNPIAGIERERDGFRVVGRDRDYHARTVILATGVRLNDVDLPPDERARAMASGALRYCPICDGFEVTGKAVAVMGCDAHGAAEAMFLNTYAREVTLLPRARADLSTCTRRQLADAGIAVADGRTGALAITPDGVRVSLTGKAAPLTFDVLYPALGCRPRSELAAGLKLKLSAEKGIVTDAAQRTRIEGLFAAGDVVEGLDQISVAMGHAAIAATGAHNLLRERDGAVLTPAKPARTAGTARAAAR